MNKKEDELELKRKQIAKFIRLTVNLSSFLKMFVDSPRYRTINSFLNIINMLMLRPRHLIPTDNLVDMFEWKDALIENAKKDRQISLFVNELEEQYKTTNDMVEQEDHKRDLMISLKNVSVSYKHKNGISKSYGKEVWTLKDVSLNLYRGDILGVIGGKGSGKSTLLKLIAGINRPDKGKLINNGYKPLFLSMQNFYDNLVYIPDLTGRDNAIINGMLGGVRRKEVEAKMDHIISFAELKEFINQPMEIYSSRMIARLGFSVAFHIDPDILIIDEALEVGDASFKKKVANKVYENIFSDKTVVLTAHNINTINQLCNKVIWMENGKVKLDGDKESVLQEYVEYTGKSGGEKINLTTSLSKQTNIIINYYSKAIESEAKQPERVYIRLIKYLLEQNSFSAAQQKAIQGLEFYPENDQLLFLHSLANKFLTYQQDNEKYKSINEAFTASLEKNDSVIDEINEAIRNIPGL